MASAPDLPRIVALLHDDELGGKRESLSDESAVRYQRAFEQIAADENSTLLVAKCGLIVLGCLQLTFVRSLSYQGARRCLVEDVGVDSTYRKLGMGRMLVKAAEERARENMCELMELFVNDSRNIAIQFYSQLGFECHHRGIRKALQRVATLTRMAAVVD